MWPKIRWTPRSVRHIARHRVRPHEVEALLRNDPLVRRHRGVYLAIGVSQGRYLMVAFRLAKGHRGCQVVTARPASNAEKRPYRRKKKP